MKTYAYTKAGRQEAKRDAKQGNRYARQQAEHRCGSNVRVYEKLGLNKGYIQIRVRDGKQVSKTPA